MPGKNTPVITRACFNTFTTVQNRANSVKQNRLAAVVRLRFGGAA